MAQNIIVSVISVTGEAVKQVAQALCLGLITFFAAGIMYVVVESIWAR